MIIDVTARRVSALTDAEINGLLDAHLFGHSPLCLGHSAGDGTGVYRCTWCQAIDDRAVASRIFDVAYGHYREAPIYTMAQIVEEMNKQSQSAQAVYALSLEAQIFGDTLHSVKRTPNAKLTQRYLNITVRRVSIAALTALGIIDEHGFVRER